MCPRRHNIHRKKKRSLCCSAGVSRALPGRFNILSLVVAFLLFLPQLLYPLHLATKHHQNQKCEPCCSAVCTSPSPSSHNNIALASVVITNAEIYSQTHDACTLCLAYKLAGGNKILTVEPGRLSFPCFLNNSFSPAAAHAQPSFLYYKDGSRAPPL